MTSTRLLVPAAALLLVLAGCAQAQPTVTDDPVVVAPSDSSAPAPDPKPTAMMPDAIGPLCYEDFGFTADEEQHGGTVTWPAPLSDDAIGVEPSCWVDQLDTERNLFLAGWYGLDDAQYDLVNGPIESALQSAGFELQDDTNGITVYSKPTGQELEDLAFQISRTDGYYELAVTYGRG
jgi:hypothetical protein